MAPCTYFVQGESSSIRGPLLPELWVFWKNDSNSTQMLIQLFSNFILNSILSYLVGLLDQNSSSNCKERNVNFSEMNEYSMINDGSFINQKERVNSVQKTVNVD